MPIRASRFLSAASLTLGLAAAWSTIAVFPAAAASVLYSFKGGSDGSNPEASLIADQAGNLYGTTEIGGSGAGCDDGLYGCGTVFKLAPDGSETIVHAFQGGSDGAFPLGALIFDAANNLYGTASNGGSVACANGCGTVFKIAANGSESVVYAFQGGSDGTYPATNLIMDGSGNLYGTTEWGGNFSGSECTGSGCGTIFEIKSNGTKLGLYSFLGGDDGAAPLAGLVLGHDGNFYGTTSEGGINCNADGVGCGTIFKLTKSGAETVVHAFEGNDDGAVPEGAGLFADKAGNLYGTTTRGGAGPCGCGTVFKVASDGTESVLYAFKGGNDGNFPASSLVMDGAGNLYGTTFLGGGSGCKENGCGTVYRLAPDGTETVLLSFGKRGKYPGAALLLLKQSLYGTAPSGGAHRDGVVFKLKK